MLENSASQNRKSKQEKRFTKEETAVMNNIDKRATVKRRKKLEEKRLLEKETAVRSKIVEKYLLIDLFYCNSLASLLQALGYYSSQ